MTWAENMLGTVMSHNTLRPIVKWTGNRASISNMVLSCLPNNYKSYWEPFVGNAAIALRIFDSSNEELYLSDSNAELVSFYQALRDYSPTFIDEIKSLAAEFNKAPNLEVTFRNMRDYYNKIEDGKERSLFFYILNQTCYNGMMRYNKNGRLNSSFSGRKCEIYPNTIQAFADFLRDKRVHLFHCDFDELDPEEQDIVFLGPPDQRKWYMDHRHKLQGLWEAWSSKGVLLLLTGKDEQMLQELFSGWDFTAIGKRLMILNY